MKESSDKETLGPNAWLVEVAHFGVRTWREKGKPTGYSWPFVSTAVLAKQEGR